MSQIKNIHMYIIKADYTLAWVPRPVARLGGDVGPLHYGRGGHRRQVHTALSDHRHVVPISRVYCIHVVCVCVCVYMIIMCATMPAVSTGTHGAWQRIVHTALSNHRHVVPISRVYCIHRTCVCVCVYSHSNCSYQIGALRGICCRGTMCFVRIRVCTRLSIGSCRGV